MELPEIVAKAKSAGIDAGIKKRWEVENTSWPSGEKFLEVQYAVANAMADYILAATQQPKDTSE